MPKQISPAKRWCFTWNNYPDGAVSSIVPVLKALGAFIIGREVGEGGTPHLQGYVEFSSKKRALSVGLPKGIHWEKAKGSRAQNIAYCSKDGDYVHDGLSGVPEPIAKMKFAMLRPAQRAISALFAHREDPLFGRLIYWFWEPRGMWGKSLTAMHLIDYRDAIVLGGKRSDILCGIASVKKETGRTPRVCIFDIPRACGSRVSYSAIESVKNGFFFSGKYESGMVRFNRPHCVVFANEPPTFGDLSGDRWRVRNLCEHDALMRAIRMR